MSSRRITERCPNSGFIGVAKVSGWKLLFNKRSKDGSGKANLVYTGTKLIREEQMQHLHQICTN